MWHQAIILTNAVLLSIRPLVLKFSEIVIKILNFSFTKMHRKISWAKWRPFCPRRGGLTPGCLQLRCCTSLVLSFRVVFFAHCIYHCLFCLLSIPLRQDHMGYTMLYFNVTVIGNAIVKSTPPAAPWLAWIYFDPSYDKQLHLLLFTYPLPNSNGAAV